MVGLKNLRDELLMKPSRTSTVWKVLFGAKLLVTLTLVFSF